MRYLLTFLVMAATGLCLSTASFANEGTEITWLGHSSFRVTTPGGKVLFVDPWITNPANPKAKEAIEGISKADLLLLTHGHGDHIGNTVEIAKKTGAKLVATFDLMKAMVQYGGLPESNTDLKHTGHFGGRIELLDGDVTVQFVPAVHGGGMDAVESSKMPKSLVYGGNPGGFIISVKNGPKIYHTGDTDLFSDMALLGEVDIVMICIGDKFTMGPQRAARAVRMLGPRMAIPMHYGTFAALTGTPEQFRKELEQYGQSRIMKQLNVGESIFWK